MLRPVSYEGVAFDAVGARITGYGGGGRDYRGTIEIGYPGKKAVTVARIYYSTNDPKHEAIRDQWYTLGDAWHYKVTSELNFLIQQALSAPVLVTEEVLAGMPKDATFLHNPDPTGHSRWFDISATRHYNIFHYNIFADEGEIVMPTNIIARDYLLGFTTEGVRHGL